MLLDARAVASSEQASAPPTPMTPPPAKIDVKGMNFYYGTQKALDDIDLQVFPNQVTAFIADEADPIRAGVLAALAVAVPTVTAIANAHLWERASTRRAREQIVLFNITTLTTIAIGFATLFVALFVLTTVGALLLVPSNLFAHRLLRVAASISCPEMRTLFPPRRTLPSST